MHRILFIFNFLILFIGFASLTTSFNRVTYYDTIMQSDTNKINAVIKSLNNSTFEAKEAFKGALLMKKAQYLKRTTDKLSLFKKRKVIA